jgi:dihydroorotate dehydrogenase electron transfer subunit
VLTRKVSIAPESYLFTLGVDADFPRAAPGQFIHVAASDELALRRPFSVAGEPGTGAIDLLIELRGRGTRALAERPTGAELSVMGPLGRGFTPPPDDDTAILVAGGIGVAGLRLLAEELSRGTRELVTLVGARTHERLLDHLLPAPTNDGRVRLEVATDDGSAGLPGTVCDLLARELAGLRSTATVYCCGPPGMIREASALAIGKDLPCEILLEEIMACGVGACRGCVVATRNGYRAACSDGPVFDAREIVFEGDTRV